MTPTLVEEPTTGDDWIHEIKYDGYRTQLMLQEGKARAYTRRGVELNRKPGNVRRRRGLATAAPGRNPLICVNGTPCSAAIVI
jgi:ATP-dependent DNA ligase